MDGTCFVLHNTAERMHIGRPVTSKIIRWWYWPSGVKWDDEDVPRWFGRNEIVTPAAITPMLYSRETMDDAWDDMVARSSVLSPVAADIPSSIALAES